MNGNKELKVHSIQLTGRSLCSIRSNRKWCKRRGSSLQCQNCFFVYTISDCNLKNFVVPLKSNITANTDKTTYFALPPNLKTKSGNFHGVYYIKLFPIEKKYIQPYLYKGNVFLEGIKNIIDGNDKIIISACQDYLNEYEQGNRNKYTPDIDAIIELLNKKQSKDQSH